MRTAAVLLLTILLGYTWELFPSKPLTPFIGSDYEIDSQWYLYFLIDKLRLVLLVWLLYLNTKDILRLVSLMFLLFYILGFVDYLLFYDNPFPVYTFVFKVIASIVLTYFLSYERTGDNNINNNKWYS